MIGLIMAGGKGTRMNLDNEKLLLKYKKPVILHAVDSLKESNCFSKILALTSPNSPLTKKLLQENNIDIFNTDGIGYVEDLTLVLQSINDSVLVTSGDLPLLDHEIINFFNDEIIIPTELSKMSKNNLFFNFVKKLSKRARKKIISEN